MIVKFTHYNTFCSTIKKLMTPVSVRRVGRARLDIITPAELLAKNSGILGGWGGQGNTL